MKTIQVEAQQATKFPEFLRINGGRVKVQINEITGNPEALFGAKLINDLSETVMVNSNKKNYKVATVEFVNHNAEMISRQVIVHEGNYAHKDANIEVGKTYLTKVSFDPAYEGPLMVMSHLEGAGSVRASNDDFGWTWEETVPSGAASVEPVDETNPEVLDLTDEVAASKKK